MYDLRRSSYGAQKGSGSYSQIALTSRPGVEGHHSVGVYGATTPAAFAKSVNQDHLGRGWLDTFYNVLIWPDGTVIEGRPLSARSGSVSSVTICKAGNYSSRTTTHEMRNAIIGLRSHLMGQGLPNRVGWHGQRASTSCPGSNAISFWRYLPDLGEQRPTELGDRILRLQDSPFMQGPDVKEWQEMLNIFLSSHRMNTLTTDGVFGPRTAEGSSFFMQERMGVDTNDPRVGPRTIEAMQIWLKKHDQGKGRDEPDYIVAVLASSDVDEGMARVLGKKYRWKYLRYPEEAKDYTIGTAVLVGAAVRRSESDQSPVWSDTRELVGANRDETAAVVASRIVEDRGDSRTP